MRRLPFLLPLLLVACHGGAEPGQFDPDRLERAFKDPDRFNQNIDVRQTEVGVTDLVGLYVPDLGDEPKFAGYVFSAEAGAELTITVTPLASDGVTEGGATDPIVLVYSLPEREGVGGEGLAKVDDHFSGKAEALNLTIPDDGIYVAVIAEFNLRSGRFRLAIEETEDPTCQPAAFCQDEDGKALCGIVEDGCGATLNCGPCDHDLRIIDPMTLEVFHQGEWRGVCDDNFGREEAEVACRQLGGQVDASAPLVHFKTQDNGNGSFWLDDVNCQGDEARLEHCVHSGFGNASCGSSEHVGIQCRLPLAVKLEGQEHADGELRLGAGDVLEIFHAGEFRGVCDDNFNRTAAEVACRQMGQELVQFQTSRNGNGQFWLDDIQCQGDEDGLPQCRNPGWGRVNCGSSEHVRVQCRPAQ